MNMTSLLCGCSEMYCVELALLQENSLTHRRSGLIFVPATTELSLETRWILSGHDSRDVSTAIETKEVTIHDISYRCYILPLTETRWENFELESGGVEPFPYSITLNSVRVGVAFTILDQRDLEVIKKIMSFGENPEICHRITLDPFLFGGQAKLNKLVSEKNLLWATVYAEQHGYIPEFGALSMVHHLSPEGTLAFASPRFLNTRLQLSEGWKQLFVDLLLKRLGEQMANDTNPTEIENPIPSGQVEATAQMDNAAEEGTTTTLPNMTIGGDSTTDVNMPLYTTTTETPPDSVEMWALKTFLERPQHFLKYSWEAGSTEHTSIEITSKLMQETSFAPIFMSVHSYFKSDFKFRIMTNVHKFASGRIAVYYVPPTRSDIWAHSRMKFIYSGYDHVEFDVATGGEQVLDVPFSQVFDRIGTMAHRGVDYRTTLGQLIILPIVPLEVATGSASKVEMNIMVSLMNPVLEIPSPTHKLFSAALALLTTMSSAQGPTYDEMKEQVVEGAGKLASAATTATIKLGMRYLGLDNPTDMDNIKDRLLPPTSSLATGDGKDVSRRLGLSTGRAMRDHTTEGDDALQILNLTKKFETAAYVNPGWANTSGQAFVIPVSPRFSGCSVYSDNLKAIPGTHLAYISTLFEKWSGSLVFRFDIVTSLHSTGRFGVIWLPEIDDNMDFSTKNLANMISGPTQILDISVDRTLEVTVPYVAPTPFKYTPTMTSLKDNGGNLLMSYSPDTHNGVLVVWPLNEISIPPNCPSAFHIMVKIKAGDDFEVALPSDVMRPLPASRLDKAGGPGDQNGSGQISLVGRTKYTYQHRRPRWSGNSSQMAGKNRSNAVKKDPLLTPAEKQIYTEPYDPPKEKPPTTATPALASAQSTPAPTQATAQMDFISSHKIERNRSLALYGENHMDLRLGLRRKTLALHYYAVEPGEPKIDSGYALETNHLHVRPITPNTSYSRDIDGPCEGFIGMNEMDVRTKKVTCGYRYQMGISNAYSFTTPEIKVEESRHFHLTTWGGRVALMYTFWSGSMRSTTQYTAPKSSSGLIRSEHSPNPPYIYEPLMFYDCTANDDGNQIARRAIFNAQHGSNVQTYALGHSAEVETPYIASTQKLYVVLPRSYPAWLGCSGVLQTSITEAVSREGAGGLTRSGVAPTIPGYPRSTMSEYIGGGADLTFSYPAGVPAVPLISRPARTHTDFPDRDGLAFPMTIYTQSGENIPCELLDDPDRAIMRAAAKLRARHHECEATAQIDSETCGYVIAFSLGAGFSYAGHTRSNTCPTCLRPQATAEGLAGNFVCALIGSWIGGALAIQNHEECPSCIVERQIRERARNRARLTEIVPNHQVEATAQMDFGDVRNYLPSPRTLSGVALVTGALYGGYRVSLWAYSASEMLEDRISTLGERTCQRFQHEIEEFKANVGAAVQATHDDITTEMDNFREGFVKLTQTTEASINHMTHDVNNVLRSVSNATRSADNAFTTLENETANVGNFITEGPIAYLINTMLPQLLEAVDPQIFSAVRCEIGTVPLVHLGFLAYDAARYRGDKTDLAVLLVKVLTLSAPVVIDAKIAGRLLGPDGAPRAQFGWQDVLTVLQTAQKHSGTVMIGTLLVGSMAAKATSTRRGTNPDQVFASRENVSRMSQFMDIFGTSLNDLGKISMSIFTITRAAPIIQKLMDQTLALLGIEDTADAEALAALEDESEEIINWARQVTELAAPETRHVLSTSDAMRTRVLSLQKQGGVYETTLMNRVPHPGMRLAFNHVKKTCDELAAEAFNSRFRSGFRREPFHVALSGRAGAGKTTVLPLLLRAIGEDEGYTNATDIYCQPPGDPYMSNYRNEYAFLMDDLPLSTSESTEQMILEFIHMKSNNPHGLNQAALHEKGQQFTSCLMGSTTNNAMWAPPGLFDKQALLRRRDVLLEVSNISAPMSGTLELTFDHMRFSALDPLSGNVICGDMTYEETKAYVKRAHRFFMWKEFVRLTSSVGLEVAIAQFSGPIKEFLTKNLERLNTGRHNQAVIADIKCDFVATAHMENDNEEETEPEMTHEEAALLRGALSALRPESSLNLPRTLILRPLYFLTVEEMTDYRSTRGNAQGRQALLLHTRSLRLAQHEAAAHGMSLDRWIDHHEALFQERDIFWQFQQMPSRLRRWLTSVRERMSTPSQIGVLLTLVTVPLLALIAWYCMPNREQRDVEAGVRPPPPQAESSDSSEDDPVPKPEARAPNLFFEPGASAQSEDRYGMRDRRGKMKKRVGKTVLRAYDSMDSLGSAQMETPSRYDVVYPDDLKSIEVAKKVASNTVYIKLPIENGRKNVHICCVGVGGSVIMMPAHYWPALSAAPSFTIFHPHGYRIPCTHDSLVDKPLIADIEFDGVLHPNDLAFIRVRDKAFRPLKKIANLFMTSEEINNQDGAINGFVDIRPNDPSGKASKVIGPVVFGQSEMTFSYKYPNEMNKYATAADVWWYCGQTMAGDCGSIAYAINPNKSEGRVFGMHVAGVDSEPRAAIMTITRDTVEAGLDHYREIPPSEIHPRLKPTIVPAATAQMLAGNFEIIGKTTQPNHIPRNTAYLLSDIGEKEVFPRMKEPAVLKDHDPRLIRPTDILKKSIEKYGYTGTGMTRAEQDELRDYYATYYHNLSLEYRKEHGEPRVVSYRTALLSSEAFEHVKGIDPTTSCGYPYKLEGFTKRYAIEALDNGEVSVLQERVNERMELAAQREIAPTVFLDVLKDEKRSLKKIAEGSTRSFNIVPLDLNIMVRMLTMSFVDMCQANRDRSFSQVGINPTSIEFHKIYQQFSKFNDTYDADYKAFDGRIHPDFWDLFFTVINDYYDDVYAAHRETLAATFQRRISIAGDLVYIVFSGNPSGMALTTVFNSFVNATYMRLAYMRVMKRKVNQIGVRSFDQHIIDKNYGDDLILATDLPCEIMNELFSEINDMGLTITDGNKTGLPKPTPLDELVFLKRTFKIQGNCLYYGALDKDSIYGICNYVLKSNNSQDGRMMQYRMALRDAFFHGPEFYDHLRNGIISVNKIYNYLPKFGDMAIAILLE